MPREMKGSGGNNTTTKRGVEEDQEIILIKKKKKITTLATHPSWHVCKAKCIWKENRTIKNQSIKYTNEERFEIHVTLSLKIFSHFSIIDKEIFDIWLDI